MSTGPVNYESGWTGPALGALAVTNAAFATEDLVVADALYPRAIYVGTGGDLAVSLTKAVPTAGQPTQVDLGAAVTGVVVFKNVPAGTILPIAVKNIYRTTGGSNGNTTAQDLVILY